MRSIRKASGQDFEEQAREVHHLLIVFFNWFLEDTFWNKRGRRPDVWSVELGMDLDLGVIGWEVLRDVEALQIGKCLQMVVAMVSEEVYFFLVRSGIFL